MARAGRAASLRGNVTGRWPDGDSSPNRIVQRVALLLAAELVLQHRRHALPMAWSRARPMATTTTVLGLAAADRADELLGRSAAA